MPTLTDYQDQLAHELEEVEKYRRRAANAHKEHRERERKACENHANNRERMIQTYLRKIAELTREHQA